MSEMGNRTEEEKHLVNEGRSAQTSQEVVTISNTISRVAMTRRNGADSTGHQHN